jgi:hypothetical protein
MNRITADDELCANARVDFVITASRGRGLSVAKPRSAGRCNNGGPPSRMMPTLA